MMIDMTKRFSCFVDGKQYDYAEFFYRKNGKLCFCSVSMHAIGGYVCLCVWCVCMCM